MLDPACKTIKELRLEKGLSQEDLAKISGYEVSTIGKYERSKTNDVRLSVFEDLINSLGYELKIVKKEKK